MPSSDSCGLNLARGGHASIAEAVVAEVGDGSVDAESFNAQMAQALEEGAVPVRGGAGRRSGGSSSTGACRPPAWADEYGLDEVYFAEHHTLGLWRIEGKYWNADMPAFDEHLSGPRLKFVRDGGPEFLMTGMQPNSPTLAEAGRRGISPVSQAVHADLVRMHGDTYATAPSRADWRIVRDWFVADTDEARELALNGSLAKIGAYTSRS